ncbi:MAG: S8 family peptidase [Lachnospira sp.]|nr:S8 family peptidase [Lachnospira sp.]
MRVGVAVIDTGIYRHIDFDNRIIGFKDFVNERSSPYDDSGHGTHVSGIICGSGRASKGKYKGLAPEAAIVSVKVLDMAGNGRIANVIDGTRWILKMKDYYNIKVVNISFGTTMENQEDEAAELVEAIDNLWNAGIVVVAAAGNSGPGKYSVTAPGICKSIITVGAYDDQSFKDGKEHRKKYFSGRGPTRECIMKPEVVVAGSNIVACSNRKNSYSMKSGTSMAAPIVSGAIARLLNQKKMTPKEIKIRLRSCCSKIEIPANQQGWGMLDVIRFISEK